MLIPKLLKREYGIFVIGNFQICFGNIDIPANQTNVNFNFPRSFNGQPIVVVSNSNVYADDVYWSVGNTLGSSVNLWAKSVSKGNTVMLRARYIAIGIAS